VTTVGYESTHTAVAQSHLDGGTAGSAFLVCCMQHFPASRVVTMATELLVECVRKYPMLYMSNEDYRNVRNKDQLWDETGKELYVPVKYYCLITVYL
jgi:hypothetical protein